MARKSRNRSLRAKNWQAKEALANIVQLMEDFEDTQKQSLNPNPNSHTNCPALTHLKKVFGIVQSCLDLFPLTRFEKTRRRLSLAQEVMSNTLVVRQILNSIDHIRDFKSLRLVNKQWEKEVDSALWRQSSEPRCSFSLPVVIGFRRSARLRRLMFPDYSLDYDFDEVEPIEDFPTKPFQFPCTDFRFFSDDLTWPNSVEFFSKYGRWIKHLSLNVDERTPTLSDAKPILAERVPNLATLTLNSVPPQNSDFSNLPKLPNLKVLTLPAGTSPDFRDGQKYCSMVFEILKAAPNLKAIKSTRLANNTIDSSWLREIMAAEKVSLIQRLELRLIPEFLDDIELFCTKKPRLVALSLDFSKEFLKIRSPRIAALLNCLLDLTKDSLQELDGLGGITEVDEISGPLHFPVMSKVTTVNVRKMETPLWKKILPPRIKLKHVFPHIKNLDLGRPVFWGRPGSWPEYIKSRLEILIDANASDTLEKLRVPSGYINYKPPFLKLEKAASMYPNLKVLTLSLEMDPPGPNFGITCVTIWRFFPNLEILEFNCEFPRDGEYKKDAHLTAEFDSAVTGVDPETCRKMAKMLEHNFDRWNPFEFEREYLKDNYLASSIKKLRNLREFRVHGWRDNDRPFFSKFAVLYALKPLQRNVHTFVDTCEI